MTDTDALNERIARVLYSNDFPTHMGGWDHARALAKERYADRADAVLPIVAVEVRKAKAEALREAALQYGPGQLTGMFSRDGYTRAWLQARATEYETGDSDEHR